MIWVAFSALMLAASATKGIVKTDFNKHLRVSQTSTTLQVVSNPILDREFTSPNGTVFPNPIHDNAWQSLAQLEADFVRFVPWFPYPWKSVAELDAPVSGKPTSWNFEHIIPQFYDFMNATHTRGHSTVINFSTQPCWLYNAKNCSYPANPDQSDFGYVRGNALKDPTATDLAAYYGRLLSWMMKGEFVDEHNITHTGGPGFSNMTYWEVFNEGEHGYNASWYTHDYDKVVSKIREEADPEHRLKFVGIGGASPSWIPYFLNRSNHIVKDIPLDYVSVHFYAGCSNRTDPTTYEEFFSRADGFILGMNTSIIPSRDQHSPSTKFDLDELGVIMPDDNDPSFGIDGNLPNIYWNAAGAMYAYLFGNLALMGVDVLGHSQLAGSPKIPEWGIPLPQYPSVSLLDWRTGYGNARYWVLKLLLENFAPGDIFVNTTVSIPPPSPPTPANPFCGYVVGPNYGSVDLSCSDTSAVISKIDFTDWGTPTGECGAFSVDKKCTEQQKTLALVTKECLNKHSCSVRPYPALGDPCLNVVKKFVVQAECSTGGGFANNHTTAGPPVYALGAIDGKSQEHKLLLINKSLQPIDIALEDFASSSTGHYVDPTTVQQGGSQGIGSQSFSSSLTLAPFAVVVLRSPPHNKL
eukprot:m.266817 g.266817  ORF g.266817 m.266817 type:complete len:637 (+) comp31560_c0_seq1:162-2072(+)